MLPMTEHRNNYNVISSGHLPASTAELIPNARFLQEEIALAGIYLSLWSTI